MRAIVLYASKSGNTKKIADSISDQTGAPSIRITKDSCASSKDLEGYDLIFLGTGLYAGTPNEDLVAYLKNLKLESTALFALFITWGGAPRSDKMALTKLRALLESKKQRVLEEHFAAYGGWKGILMKRGHPKSDEVAAAGVWGKKVFGEVEKQVKLKA
ncbi:MAG: hypothetical protein NWE93_04095 [Candidatus Bathyarchaeota archaeon]|nr:hypothetical protein [Candidatus Bathyarchaeota archaeon]